MKCIDCGCDEENRDSLIRGSGGMVHQRWSYCLKATIKERDELARRVAELEARLADEWRPVTEKPEKSGHYLAYDADGEQFLFAGVGPYRVARWDGKWNSDLNGLNDCWRPLPPPPTATE